MPGTANEQGQAEPGRGRELNPKLLAAKTVARVLQQRSRRSPGAIGIVLMHHEVAPRQGDPDEVLPALGAEMFRAQLEHLKRNYEVVSLRELVARAAERSPGERLPVALTFDDDLAGHALIAAPILESFGFPATFFLNGSTLHGPSPYWWQDLQVILDRGPDARASLTRELANRWPWAGLDGRFEDLTNTIEALPPGERDAVAARLRELAGDDVHEQGLRADAVRDLVAADFEIGAHTLRHYNLPTLQAKELDRAMREGVDELEEVVGYRPTAIGYPHGKADLRVAEAAQRAGFDIGVVSTHQVATPDQNPLLIDRVNAWTDSLASFAWALARLSRPG